MVFDFGEVWEGAPARGEFTVKNVGDAPLNVALKSTCGCTVVSDPKTPLAPGETTTFTITYATTRVGKANKLVKVMTNDRDQKQLQIPVRGTVKQLFELKPGRTIAFNQLEDTDQKTRTILIENRYEQPLKLKLMESRQADLSHLKIELNEKQEGQQYELVVTTNPPLPFGLKRANVVLESDHEDLPPLKIPVSMTVRPRVAISPVRIFIPRQSAPPRKAIFRITHKQGANIKLKGARLGDRDLEFTEYPELETASKTESAFIRFEVMLPGSDEIEGDQATLKVLTEGDPDFTELDVAIIRRGTAHPGRKAVPGGDLHATTQPHKATEEPNAADPEEEDGDGETP